MYKSLSSALALVLAFQASLITDVHSAAKEPQRDQIHHSKQHAKAAIEIVRQLEHRHYIGKRFDDDLSSKFFDNYFKSLDGNRTFFLQSDIDEFEPYRKELDDLTRSGKLEIGFKIFNRFQQRLISRLEKTIEQLPSMVEGMDFSRDEHLELDREKSSWPKKPFAWPVWPR